MKHAFHVMVLILLGFSAARADLSTESDAWDDLSRWLAGHREAGGVVRVGASVDLGQVPAGSGLALLAPGEVTEPAGVRRFVQEGGRVLIAVDDEGASALLREFETGVQEAPVGGEVLGGHEALVVLRPPDARVFAGVGALVTNRPVALTPIRDLEPAIRFADGSAFAWHLKLGEGELLVVGDASLFINLMLDAGGNRTFAANVASWLSRGGTVPLTVVGGGVPLTGTYGAPPPSAVEGINGMLAHLAGEGAPDVLLVHVLLALLLAAVTAYTLLVFPGRPAGRPGPSRPSAESGAVERAAGAPGGPAAPESGWPGERVAAPVRPSIREPS